MDYELLNRIGVLETDPQRIIDELEGKKLDFEERMENMEDEGRRKQLEEKISRIDELILQAKEELEKAKQEAKEEPKEEADLIAVSEEKASAPDEIPVAIGEQEEAEEAVKQEDGQKSAPASGAKGKTDKEKADELHEKELEKKAAAIQKAAEKARRDAQKTADRNASNSSARPEAAASSENNRSADADGSGAAEPGTKASAVEYEQAYNDGMQAFGSKNYKEAETQFSKLGNANKRAKIKKEQGGNACYLLGRIYMGGLNGAASQDRAEFWFKQAADRYEHIEGCIEYALICVSKPPANKTEDEKNIDTALRYLAVAADLGNANAGKAYIDICENRNVTSAQRRKAIQYINKDIAKENDSYIQKSLKEKKKKLKKKQTRTGGGDPGKGGIIGVIAYAGAVLAVYAVMNMFAGVFCSSGSKILAFGFLPEIPSLFGAQKTASALEDAGSLQLFDIKTLLSAAYLWFIANVMMGMDSYNDKTSFQIIKGISSVGLSMLCFLSAVYITYSLGQKDCISIMTVSVIAAFIGYKLSVKIGSFITDIFS